MSPPSIVTSSMGVQPITRSCTNPGVAPVAAPMGVEVPMLVGDALLPMFELSNWMRKLSDLYAVPDAWSRARRRKKSLSKDRSTDPSKVPS